MNIEKKFYNFNEFSSFCKRHTKVDRKTKEETYLIDVHYFEARDTFDEDGFKTGVVYLVRYSELGN